MLKRQRSLEQRRQSRSSFRMSQIGLHGTQVYTLLAEDRCNSPSLNWITGERARGVALEKPCLGQIRYTGLLVDSPNQCLLCRDTWYCQRVRFPIKVRTPASNYRPNRVAVTYCRTERFDVDR
jgi:hypothetical protein